jgi:hypothetical protein
MTSPKVPDSFYSGGDEPQPEEIEFMAFVGRVVFMLEETEAAIRACEQIVLGNEIQLFSADKRALGRLVADLKTKAHLDPDFQKFLEAWIENRNILIHRTSDQLWYHAKTQAEFKSGFTFFEQLLAQTERVKSTFEALALGHFRQLSGGYVDAPEYLKRSMYLDAIELYSDYARRAR